VPTAGQLQPPARRLSKFRGFDRLCCVRFRTMALTHQNSPMIRRLDPAKPPQPIAAPVRQPQEARLPPKHCFRRNRHLRVDDDAAKKLLRLDARSLSV
jgi:hypothetical protein